MTSDLIEIERSKRFIFFTVFLSALGMGIVLPVLPHLIQDIQGSTFADAILVGAWISAVYAAFHFICGPLMGNLSDRFGRRPILLLTLTGFGIDFLLMAFAPTLVWLFIGRIIAGGLGAISGPANAAISDITPPAERADNFGKVMAVFGIGFIIGPAIGGVLGELGARIPFLFAGILALMNAAYGFFVFTETLDEKLQRSFHWQRANPAGAVINLSKTSGIMPLMALFFTWAMAVRIIQVLWPYFAPIQYGWGPGLVGISLMIFCASMIVVQAFLIKPLVSRYGERKTIIMSICAGVVFYLLFAFLTNGVIALIIAMFFGLQNMATPSISAMMSKRISDEQQGELQGLNGSITALAMLLGSLTYLPLLKHFTADENLSKFGGAPFLLAAIFALISLSIVIPMKREKDRNSK